MKDYENYLLKEKIPFKELPDLDNFNYEIKKDDINFDNLQSDNYITDSSDSNEENNIIDNKFSIENKDNRSDGDDGSDNDNKKKILTVIIIKRMKTIREQKAKKINTTIQHIKVAQIKIIKIQLFLIIKK